jgi:hypothetical protein
MFQQVLLLNGEVAVLASGAREQLVFALSRAEWSGGCVARSVSSFAVGAVLRVEPSGTVSPDVARWVLAAAVASEQQPKNEGSTLSLGSVYELVVDSVAQHHINVRKSTGERGRIHISEIVEDSSNKHNVHLSK